MATDTAVPVTVTAEAAERIAELGMAREFEQMVAHAKQTAPALRAIEVRLQHDRHARDEPGVVLWIRREEPGVEDDATDRNWARWQVMIFPPAVCRQFSMISVYEAGPDER
jgi:hypothetical protein